MDSHVWFKARNNSDSDLSFTHAAACHLVAQQIKWKIMCSLKYIKSASTCSLNAVVFLSVGMVSFAGLLQALHSLHVLTTSGINARIWALKPAALKTLFMASLEACHHRRCSFLSSRCLTCRLPTCRARKERLTSNLVQSPGASVPAPASWKVLRVRAIGCCGSENSSLRSGLYGSMFPCWDLWKMVIERLAIPCKNLFGRLIVQSTLSSGLYHWLPICTHVAR